MSELLESLAAAPFLLFNLIGSGIHPRRGDPTAWYDRIIRSVGGSILLLFLVVAIIVGWIRIPDRGVR